MAGDKKEADPFAGFTDHSSDEADTDGNLIVNDPSNEGGNDTVAELVDNDDDGADDEGQDGNSQKEMNLGEEEDPDEDTDELEDGSEEGSDEEDGGEDDGHGQSQDDPDDFEDEDEEDEPEPAPKKKKQTAEQRIAQFRKNQGKADRRATTAETLLEQANSRIAELEGNLTSGNDNGSADADDDFGLTRPDPKDFKYGEMDNAYQEAIGDYRVDRKLAQRDAKNESSRQEVAAQETAQALMETYDARVVDGITAYEDFEKVVVDAADSGKFPLGETVGMLALNSKVGHHVLYKIAGDLTLAKKLDAMTPAEAGREFGRLEAQFDTRTPKKSKKKRTNTTPPASRRRGGKAGSGRTKGNTKDFRAFEAQAEADERARTQG